MALVPVQFVVAQTPYNTGEIAGFTESIAARLVAQKRAVYVAAEGSTGTEPSVMLPEPEDTTSFETASTASVVKPQTRIKTG